MKSYQTIKDIFKRYWLLLALILVSLVSTYVVSSKLADSQFKVVYSLDKRQNDQEIISLINSADHYIYFAVYYFTEKNIADALISAHRKGLDVRGIIDHDGSLLASNKNVMDELTAAGISVETQVHQDGIMHMKLLVTDKAYASGSYNWTSAATLANDEVLEISTDDSVRRQYLAIIRKVFEANATSIDSIAEANKKVPEYDYTEAPDHIGQYAKVSGTVSKVTKGKSGTIFFTFCKTAKGCPFSAVIFSSDSAKFKDVSIYVGKVTITGVIRSYQNEAEIVLDDPGQVIVQK